MEAVSLYSKELSGAECGSDNGRIPDYYFLYGADKSLVRYRKFICATNLAVRDDLRVCEYFPVSTRTSTATPPYRKISHPLYI